MVAKGLKRSDDGVAPPQKKAKVDTKVASVTQTIESSDLPAPCKAMLLSMLPHSLCVHQDLRTEHQGRAVEMIGEVYDAIEAKLKQIADAEGATVAEIEKSKDGLDSAVQEADARYSAAGSLVESEKPVLAQSFSTVTERKNALAVAVESQSAGSEPGLAAEKEHQELKVALAEHLKVLKEGSWETGSAKRHLDSLLPLAKKLTDESLVTALPSTCIKLPCDRSTFDTMVIDQLETTLTARLAQIAADIESEVPAKAQRAAAVSAAERMYKGAVDAQLTASDAVASALASQKDALAVLELAQNSVKAFKPTLRKAKEVADEAQAELELFHENCRVRCFEVLKTRVSVESTFTSNVEATKGEDLPSAMVSEAAVAIGGC